MFTIFSSYPIDVCRVCSDISPISLTLVTCAYFFLSVLLQLCCSYWSYQRIENILIINIQNYNMIVILGLNINKIFVSLIFLYFFSILLIPALYYILPFAFFVFILLIWIYFVSWGGSMDYWLETFPLFSCVFFSAIIFLLSTTLPMFHKMWYIVFSC